MSKNGKLKIIPLGGLGEVGKNMTAYEFQNQILIVDAGIMFPHNDMLGIDYIIPDYEYLRKKARQVVGIVITHEAAAACQRIRPFHVIKTFTAIFSCL